MLKKIGVLVVLLLILIIAVSIFVNISRPTIQATINGAHNPLHNKMTVDSRVMYPSGSGGAIYSEKASIGSHIVKLQGPFIYTQEVKVTPSFFSKEALSFDLKPKPPEEIASEAINSPTAKISNLRVFGTSIVFTVTDPKNPDDEGEESHPVAIVYDLEAADWKRLDSGDISSIKEITIPDSGVDYFYELDNE